jgi:phosphoglycerate kinase
VAAPTYAEPEKKKVVRADAFPDDLEGFDIGPQTRKAFAEFVSKAQTILWFGPLGAFEEPAFAEGSRQIAEAVVAATERGATTVTGGGDSLAMLRAFDFKDKLTHVSIGGGACLAFLEGNKLPGIVPLIKER